MLQKWNVHSFPQVFIYNDNKKLVKHIVGNDLPTIKSGLKMININA